MGRFASTVEFYTRCREPYPPEFFQTVAKGLALRGDEALLDQLPEQSSEKPRIASVA